MKEGKCLQIYLVSDSTGETVTSVARSALAHFPSVKKQEHLWSFVLGEGKLYKLKDVLISNPGIVFYTFANISMQQKIEEICSQIGVLAIPAISEIVSKISGYLGIESTNITGKQHELTSEYFSRLSAVNFAMNHDDGQALHELELADIILVGASRTSKSPTCLYLAYKGYKTANVPYVLGNNYVENLKNLKKPIIIALTIKPEILSEIRKNRIFAYLDKADNSYVNEEQISDELKEAMKLYQKNNWPIIDVSRRSVEETAALILQIYEKTKQKLES